MCQGLFEHAVYILHYYTSYCTVQGTIKHTDTIGWSLESLTYLRGTVLLQGRGWPLTEGHRELENLADPTGPTCHPTLPLIPAGGNVVLLYASKYGDVACVVNLAGRCQMERGLKERYGEEGMKAIQDQGYLDVQDPWDGQLLCD